MDTNDYAEYLDGNPYVESYAERRFAGRPPEPEMDAAAAIGFEIRRTIEPLLNGLSMLIVELRTLTDIDPGEDSEHIADPASDEFEDQVESLAERLWGTDPTSRSPARRFHEDFEAVQDRYRDQARALLDPGANDGKH